MNGKKLLIILIACLFFQPVMAYDATPRCYRELERNFFNKTDLYQVLNMYKIPQGSWPLIYSDLNRKASSVHSVIWARARKMRPHPLNNQFHAEEAEKLLREELYKIFYTTIIQYNIPNVSQINQAIASDMFTNLLSRHKELWNKCF